IRSGSTRRSAAPWPTTPICGRAGAAACSSALCSASTAPHSHSVHRTEPGRPAPRGSPWRERALTAAADTRLRYRRACRGGAGRARCLVQAFGAVSALTYVRGSGPPTVRRALDARHGEQAGGDEVALTAVPAGGGRGGGCCNGGG